MDDPIPPLPENWDRCHHFNERKRRYCRQMPVPLRPGDFSDARLRPRYCGNHRHLLADERPSSKSKNSDSDDNRCIPIASDGNIVHDESKRPRDYASRTDNDDDDKNGGRKKRWRKERGRRIPCPIDPSHFIFESAVAKHVLVCPAAKERREAAEKEYYREGINLGGFGDMGDNICLECGKDDARSMEGAKELARSILRVFRCVFLSSDGGTCGMESISMKQKVDERTSSARSLQSITEKQIYDALPEVDLSAAEEGSSSNDDGAADTPNLPLAEVHAGAHEARHIDLENSGRLTRSVIKHRIRAGGPRHLRQIASILGHVRKRGLISAADIDSSDDNDEEEKKPDDGKRRKRNPLIVEMGAGRGMTGLVVAGAFAAASSSPGHDGRAGRPPLRVSLHLVERSGTRGKAETKIRTAASRGEDDCLRLDLVDVTRVKCDLAHVDMPTALPPRLRSDASRTVVVAKHLCGAGTDIALKSLRDIGTIDGCVMATCCHGLCSWSEYVGRDCFLRLFRDKEVGGLPRFGEDQFNLLKRWTSASVLEERTRSEIHPAAKPDDNDEIKEEHYVESAEDGKGRYPSIFTVVKELGLACGGKGLGRACQRLIDFGRCEYMRKNLFVLDSPPKKKRFDVSMLHYVPRDVTPQNALLVASRGG